MSIRQAGGMSMKAMFAFTCWFTSKYHGQASAQDIARAARYLRKQGVPVEDAIAMLTRSIRLASHLI